MAFSLSSSKQNQSNPSTNCLCHKKGVQGGHLTDFSTQSWETFRNACEIRKDEISKTMEGKWNSGPYGGYHRACYKAYTSKGHLERVINKQGKDKDTTKAKGVGEAANKRLTRSYLQTTNHICCWICQKEKTDPKDRRRKEKLVNCETDSAGQNLLRTAIARCDQRLIVALTDKDPVALEVCYHKSCFRAYVNFKASQESKDSESEYDAAFKQLDSNVIQPNLFEKHQVLHMSELKEKYIEYLQLQGVHNILYRSEKLKERIKKAYPERISFWKPRRRSQSELVYCDDVPKGLIVESVVNVDENAHDVDFEVHDKDSNDDEKLLYHAAKSLRSSLLNHTTSMPWPPHASDIGPSSISLPQSVLNFLTWTLTSDDGQQQNLSVERIVQSFGQDLLYNVSKGRQKTPKHVALSLTVKNLTGSKELITMLNRFGHAISYDQVLQIETGLAEEQLKKDVNGVIIPKNIYPNVFSTFCWDNIDLTEETLSGQGTTHCTNGIVIQRQVAGCEPPPIDDCITRHTNKRTFQPITNQVTIYMLIRNIYPLSKTTSIIVYTGP